MNIYGTLGPKCKDEETLKAMFNAGMTGMRLNLSHVTLHDAAKEIETFHRAAESSGIAADLLIDMQGPELRIRKPGTILILKDHDTIVLDPSEDGPDTAAGERADSLICVHVPEIIRESLLPGQEVLIDDGKISCRVISDAPDDEKGRGRVYAEVLRGGILKDKKSIALPGADVWPPTLTKTDLINISAAREYGVTGLMQPFVRNAEDLKTVRAALNAAGAGYIRILAKIENRTGLSHIETLLPYADEFVIARGDLGNSMPLWELPAAQKRLARTVKKGGKQLMIVTQMLASMEHSRVPTRAEVCDIFNAVLDGADSVMVTGETAAGDYPADVIRYLANTAHEAEKFLLEGI